MILSIFIYLLAICISSLEKCGHDLLYILSWIILFLLLSYMNSLYIYLDINLLIDPWFANIFSRFVGCLFILLIIYFAMQKLFSLI